jgi:hypothetical protein
MSPSVPFISVTISDFNPNHKYRIVLMPSLHRLANLSFAGGDDSIYIAPRLQQTYILAGRDSGDRPFQVSLQTSQDLHLSLHHTGTVNLTIGDQRYQIRRDTQQSAVTGHLVTLGIKNPEGLESTTVEEINSAPARYSLIPVAGFLQAGPVTLSIYRVAANAVWEMPVLSDTFQTHFECELRGRDVKYEFVIWQNSAIPPWQGDVGVSIQRST